MNSNKTLILVIVIVVVLCCCVSLALLGVWGWVGYKFFQDMNVDPSSILSLPTSTPVVEVNITNQPAGEAAYESLKTLEDNPVPSNDPRDLALRLKGLTDIPETMPDPPKAYQLGDSEKFWVSNMDNNENFKVDAVLSYATEHSYFWVEDGIDYNKDDLRKLADTFEIKIYPTDRQFFGSEWTPGIDNDPHIYVLYAHNIGSSVAGYFSSVDSLSPLAHKYSNAHELFVFSADNIEFDDPYTYGTLAHEFQHMIHWYHDRNEDGWLNEGFSELAVFLNGYDTGSKYYEYTDNPDYQIMDWPSDINYSGPNYGGAFIFVKYFLDRFGDKTTQALVESKDNGIDSVDAVFKQLNITDAVTGKPTTADDFFGDWWVTNYLQDRSVGDGRYAYQNLDVSEVRPTDTVEECPLGWQDRTVHQYGVDYISIECKGNYTLELNGTTEVGVLPQSAHSGRYAFWSNKGNQSDMTLTREFDFSGVTGSLTLSYYAWFDLEKDYDYVYLEASEDGQSWTILNAPGCIPEENDPSGNSYGCGLNDKSEGWEQQEVDLSNYAGKKVQLRFEYITDAAVNGEGFMLDDVSISGIDYNTDFENGDDGWVGQGFVRIDNLLPQTFQALLIKEGSTTTVERLELSDVQTLSVPLEIGGDVRRVVLVIGGTTRFTNQLAGYRYQLK